MLPARIPAAAAGVLAAAVFWLVAAAPDAHATRAPGACPTCQDGFADAPADSPTTTVAPTTVAPTTVPPTTAPPTTAAPAAVPAPTPASAPPTRLAAAPAPRRTQSRPAPRPTLPAPRPVSAPQAAPTTTTAPTVPPTIDGEQTGPRCPTPADQADGGRLGLLGLAALIAAFLAGAVYQRRRDAKASTPPATVTPITDAPSAPGNS